MKTTPTFLHQNKPLITCQVQASTPDDLLRLMRGAAFDGCDAYGFQMESMEPQYRNAEALRPAFEAAGRKPIYLTNYRGHASNGGKTDEELAEEYLEFISMGATLIDVLGDLYCPSQYEITYDQSAIEKQKALIERIHKAGGEVLMSSHTFTFMSGEEVLAIAREHQARGADISKIVAAANSDEEEMENLRICTLLRKELKIPFLFLCSGSHTKLLRMMGPFLGSVMWLCVQQHDALSTKQQPVLRAVRNVKNSFD